MAEIRSLNKAYESEEITYWCNSCAEISLPTDNTFLTYHTPDELPPQQRDLYLNYWTDDYSSRCYVVTYNGQPGILLTHEYDGYFFRLTLNRAEPRNPVNAEVVGDEDDVYFRSVYNEAKVLARDATFDGCVIFVGDNTDPDGHELCLFVPYEKRSKLVTYLEAFDRDSVYGNVAKDVKESCATLYNLPVGDWRNGCYDTYLVESDLPMYRARKAHFLIKEKYGIDLGNLTTTTADGTVILISDIYKKLYDLGFTFDDCTFIEYEDKTLDLIPTASNVAEIWLFLLNKADPELHLRFVKYPTVPMLTSVDNGDGPDFECVGMEVLDT